MKFELNDWLKSINQSKNNIMDEHPDSKKDYAPYIINRCLSGTIDTLMYANEMNKNHSLDKRLQYDFFINSVRTRKRYSPWIKQEKIKELECIKSYYGYSNEKAKQALRILSKEQINFIKTKLEIGGMK